MRMEERINRAVERHLNYGRHPIEVRLPPRDYETLLQEIYQLVRVWEELDKVVAEDRLWMECIHGRLRIKRRLKRRAVWWHWRFRDEIRKWDYGLVKKHGIIMLGELSPWMQRIGR